jgi:excisionase family DNA binding protein
MGEVLAVSLQEAAQRLGVCKRTITNLINAKELVSRKVGRRRLVPVSALEAFMRHDHETTALSDAT